MALTEVGLFGPAADGRPSPTIFEGLSVEADNGHEAPRESDFIGWNRRFGC